MEIKLEDFFRENAYILYKGDLFGDVNHCCALELALNSENRSLNLNLETRDIFKAEEMLEEELLNKNISTWNWYSTDDKNYFVCNFKDDFFRDYNSNAIQELISKHNMELGYHTTGNDFILYNK